LVLPVDIPDDAPKWSCGGRPLLRADKRRRTRRSNSQLVELNSSHFLPSSPAAVGQRSTLPRRRPHRDRLRLHRPGRVQRCMDHPVSTANEADAALHRPLCRSLATTSLPYRAFSIRHRQTPWLRRRVTSTSRARSRRGTNVSEVQGNAWQLEKRYRWMSARH